MDTSLSKIVYTRDDLLALRSTSYGVQHPIPTELRKPLRGCRAGAKLKARRWRYKPFLPSVLMGNVNSLPNKCDELLALVRNQRLYWECSLMCFTETWLHENVPDSCVNVPGFSTVRADRDAKAIGKNKGGGLMLLVNNR